MDIILESAARMLDESYRPEFCRAVANARPRLPSVRTERRVTGGASASTGPEKRCDVSAISRLKASWAARRDPEARRARKIRKAQVKSNIARERARANAAGAAEG